MVGVVDWIGPTQDRDKLRVPLNVVMRHWVAENAGRFSSGSTIGDL
jgi:hypothetical protein